MMTMTMRSERSTKREGVPISACSEVAGQGDTARSKALAICHDKRSDDLFVLAKEGRGREDDLHVTNAPDSSVSPRWVKKNEKGPMQRGQVVDQSTRPTKKGFRRDGSLRVPSSQKNPVGSCKQQGKAKTNGGGRNHHISHT